MNLVSQPWASAHGTWEAVGEESPACSIHRVIDHNTLQGHAVERSRPKHSCACRSASRHAISLHVTSNKVPRTIPVTKEVSTGMCHPRASNNYAHHTKVHEAFIHAFVGLYFMGLLHVGGCCMCPFT